MHNFKTIFKFSTRILFREWKRFTLPFLSLTFTTLIILTVLLFTSSSSLFLDDKNKELIGGDISIEANYELEEEVLNNIIGQEVKVLNRSTQYNFSGILIKDDRSTSVSLTVVDDSYPVYGGLTIRDSVYIPPKDTEIYIDSSAEKKLGVSVGEEVLYASNKYKVVGIIEKDSRALFSGFSFLPKVIISREGFAKTGIDKSLLRSEYSYLYLIGNGNSNNLNLIIERAKAKNISLAVAGITKSGFVEGLSLVQQFLVLAVLLSCILSAVNIYAGMLYLLTIMRKSFAVLLAIGFSRKKLGITLSISLSCILALATITGGLLAVLLFNFIRSYVLTNFGLDLPFVGLYLPTIFTIIIVCGIAFASFIPSLRVLMRLNPKTLLLGGQESKEKVVFGNFITITLSTLVPLTLISVFLLDSFLYGVLSILAIIAIYVLIAIFFYYLILMLYKRRNKFKFLARTLIVYKYKDGLFGIVSLTSVFVALTSLFLLILLQSTLIDFIKRDLGEKLPSVYIVDIQKSQKDSIQENFKDVTLSPSVHARLLFIDDLDIQKGIVLSDGSVSREFGREFHLTYRSDLLQNEKITKGQWLQNQSNEVSVEKEFAERSNISLGSKIIFSIQGFEIESTVTSIRESDSRSGLPFFYFVFNPSDLEKYPATFFGYSYINEEEKINFTKYIAENFPNISIINTEEITKFAEGLIGGLLVIIFVISIPPLILALFLIVTLIVSSSDSRRKQSAQMMALGARKKFIEKLYYLETISITLFSGLLGYLTAMFGTVIIAKYFFKIKSASLYNVELILALGGIIFFILLLANVLWKSDKKPLRELLSHEDN